MDIIFNCLAISDKLKDKCLKELQIMAKLQCDHVVQYKKFWIENNQTLYIQMEMCYNSLKNIIEIKQKEFHRKNFAIMSPIEYFISSELFKEILESVNYLHKHNPPIIHGNLKLTNILITNGLNGRFVKITDIGLAEFPKLNNKKDYDGLETFVNVTPEVNKGINYYRDIYCLGLIAKELFDIDLKS